MSDIQQITQAQKTRMAIQSWDYLNQNDPRFPQLIVKQNTQNAYGLPKSLSEAILELRG